MTDVNANPLDSEQANDLVLPTEIEMLKQKATLMGITYSNNIGVDSLKAKIKEKEDALNGPAPSLDKAEDAVAAPVNPMADPVHKGKTPTLRAFLLAEQTKLVRLRITNMDPKKADLPGEILTVANEYIGTISKYVPFGEQTENGYHVPYCLYEMLKSRQFLQIKVIKRPGGRLETKTQWVREFALEVLPDLTKAEIARLAATQAARGDSD